MDVLERWLRVLALLVCVFRFDLFLACDVGIRVGWSRGNRNNSAVHSGILSDLGFRRTLVSPQRPSANRYTPRLG